MPAFKRFAMHAPVYAQYSDGAAAGLQVDGYFFIADDYYEVVEVRCNHDVNGGSGAEVDVNKVPSGTTIGSGVSVLATAFSLASGADTPQIRSNRAATLTATPADRKLSPGDSLAADYGGTLTGLLGVGITVVLKRTRLTPQR